MMDRVTIEEYSRTSYRPECEFVDGQIIERNVGEMSHSRLQTCLAAHFYPQRSQLDIHLYIGLRVYVKPDRVRAPDVCIVKGPEPEGEVLTTPPFLCIEILSPRDRAVEMFPRIDDYLEFGVPYVWLIDPWAWNGWCYQADGRCAPVRGGKFTVPFEVAMKEL